MNKDRDNAEPPLPALPSWDEKVALEAAGGDADLARELLESLVDGLPNELSRLWHCFQANDWPLLIERAHRIRGATSYCGVPALDGHLQDMERSAKTEDRHRIGLVLTRVEQEVVRLTLAIESEATKPS